jgi:GRAS domain family
VLKIKIILSIIIIVKNIMLLRKIYSPKIVISFSSKVLPFDIYFLLLSSRPSLLDLRDTILQRQLYTLMEGNSLFGCSMDEPERLASNFHRNRTDFTFSSNQHNNPIPEPFTNSGKSNWKCHDLTSYATLNYINRMLLEEDIDEKCCSFEDEVALHATEKTFYDILEQKYPLSGKTQLGIPDNSEISGDSSNSSSGESSNGSNQSRPINHFPPNQLNNTCGTVPETELTSQFNKGVEEAMKFLPNFGKLFLSSEHGSSFSMKPPKTSHLVDNKSNSSDYGAKKKFNDDPELDIIEGRAQKQKAVSSYDLVRNEKMDKTLLCRGKKYMDDVTTIREIFQKEMENELQKTRLENSKTTKAKSRKQSENGLVDLRSLLLSCAQAVFRNDHVTANEQIKKIREHSSQNGDASQRLAFYLVDGLEARLAGIGSEIYRKLASKRVPFSDVLKAYRFYLAACPYKRAALYFANQTIFNALKNETRIHIIDFSIQYGFQWPSFFERFSNWKSTPPTIRITGLDKPQSGFRPCERISETGKRLADYAQSFNIPFEYKGIASSRWENNIIEDVVGVNKNELLLANCICSEFLSDGTTISDSAREHVLSAVKKLNPHRFIVGIVNSSFNGPYFVSRFKEALYHYSSFFDMLDTTMPRDNPERLCLEKHLAQKALNGVACEGSERIERQESYKNWQSRIVRAGFVQMPLDQASVKTVKDMVKGLYHKEFVVDENNGWLLMGWKGRILYAMSTWKPNEN